MTSNLIVDKWIVSSGAPIFEMLPKIRSFAMLNKILNKIVQQ